ncbi:TELO2-interacting protein 1 homolog [Liolophura sinensis]|uniref:TELO2-interacting protein 1 homolog n=1 Tax=Liolophura sinensis TaxID=3198878 RepID=UPI003159133A
MDHSVEAFHRLFETFQPICVQLAKEHTRENVQALIRALDDANADGLQELQEYILFPLRIILKQPKKMSEELYTDVCTCMGLVLSKTTVHRWEMCFDVLTTLSVLISSPANIGKVSNVSEELKFAVIKCLDTLLKSCDSSIIEKLYGSESMPMLGHLITVMLSVAQTERARHLRLEAIHCLLTLMRTHCKDSVSKTRCRGDLFASFLPGMSMGLCKIITGDSKQGQMITVTAIEAWRQVVVLVMGDNSLQLDERHSEKSEYKDLSNERLAELKVKRDPDWVKTTSSNLLILVKEIVKLRDHSSWKVRSALVDWAVQLLIDCTNLSESVPVLLEVVVGQLRDEYDVVSSKARKGLESFSHHHMQGESGRPLVEILEDNLYSLATTLPREMRTADDSEKLSILNLLSGYIQLLGPHTCSLLRSLSHLKRLSMALVQVLEFDCTDIKITEDISHISEHGASALEPDISSVIQRPRKYFRHFSDERVLQELVHVVRLLGYYGDADILVDHFLDVFHESKVYRLPSTFILNEILVGTVTVDDTVQYHQQMVPKDKVILESLIRMLIDEFLSPTNFNLKTSNVDDDAGKQMLTRSWSQGQQLALTSDSRQPVATLNTNILQICLFLEGFGKFSQVLGTKFSPLLMKVLYPLMEKLGDENGLISTTAYLSLQEICKHCGYSSINNLLQSNSDYLVNSISVKLRHLRHNPRAPLVLKVTLQHSSPELLPLLQDTIQEVLSSLDQFYGEKAVMFMKVLHSLVLAVEKWYPPSKAGNPKLLTTQGEITSVEDVVRFFEEYHKNRLISEGNVDEDENEDEEPAYEDQMEDEDTPSEPPQHVKTVKEVLLRSRHLLSSHNPRLRLLVLDTIATAATALTDYQNVLLPLVHQVWPPFVERFSDEEKLVTLKTFQTLTSLASVCGEFIMKRTVKGIFPKLTHFLRKQAEISLKAGPAYKFTVEYKLQFSVLSDLGKLCSMMGVEDMEIETIAKSCLPYLSARQPGLLQQACILTFEKLIIIEPDSIWLLLSHLYSPEDYCPPSKHFPSVKVLGPTSWEFKSSLEHCLWNLGDCEQLTMPVPHFACQPVDEGFFFHQYGVHIITSNVGKFISNFPKFEHSTGKRNEYSDNVVQLLSKLS